MKQRPDISVIIPAYNCGLYIQECIDSLLNQTFQNFEIIVVDDGSTDGTFEKLQTYKNVDNRISVYQQEHKFAGSARNLGMSKAAGDYFIFLDSDDFFNEHLLEHALKRIKETDADICVFKANSFNNKTGKTTPMKHTCKCELCPPSGVFNRSTNPLNIFCFTVPAPWTKIFKASFVKENNLYYQNTRSANDISFVYTAMALATRISVLDEYLVNYRQHNEASLQSTQDKNPWAFYEALLDLRSRLIDLGLFDELRHAFINTALDSCIYNLRTLKHKRSTQKEVYLFLKTVGFKELEIAGKEEDYFYAYPKSRYEDYKKVMSGSYLSFIAKDKRKSLFKSKGARKLKSVVKRIKKR